MSGDNEGRYKRVQSYIDTKTVGCMGFPEIYNAKWHAYPEVPAPGREAIVLELDGKQTAVEERVAREWVGGCSEAYPCHDQVPSLPLRHPGR